MPELHPYDRQRLRRSIEDHIKTAINETIFEVDGEWSAPVYATTTRILEAVDAIYSGTK